MGYSALFSLTIEGGTDPEVVREFREVCSNAEHALENDGHAYDDTMWYDHEDDLKAFSVRYPARLFILHCVGEDGKEWKVYCKNGKSWNVTGQIVFQEFKEEFLK